MCKLENLKPILCCNSGIALLTEGVSIDVYYAYDV